MLNYPKGDRHSLILSRFAFLFKSMIARYRVERLFRKIIGNRYFEPRSDGIFLDVIKTTNRYSTKEPELVIF